MKLVVALLLTVGAFTLSAQLSQPTIIWVPTAPSGACATFAPTELVYTVSPATLWGCDNVTNLWHQIGGTSGGGTVTSFSSGNLSPLFTTSVATATTTPALSFTLSNAGAGTLFGNNTGSSAAPGFISTPVLGVASTTTGTLGFQNASNAFTFTVAGAAAMSASSTLVGPILVPANNDLLACATTSTTCTLTDSGIAASSGVISTGTWHGSLVAGTYGGTGVNNGASTITIGGNVAFSGAFTFTGTLTGNTSVTFPTSGTLSTTTGTVTSVSFTGGLISVATATTTPAFTVAGTSGGVPCFSSTSTWTSSGLLTANKILIGGGAGVCPSADANLDDGVTTANTLTYTGSGGITASAGPVTSGGGSGAGGTLTLPEGTAPSGAATKDLIYGDSTLHSFKTSVNNGSFFPMVTEQGTSDLTAQTAALTTSALFTPAVTGMVRVSYYAKVTTPGTSSILGGTTGFVLAYTDGTDSVAQSVTLTAANQSGALITIGTGNTGNATTTISYGTAMVYAKTGVAMTYSFGYSSTGTTMQYEIHVRCESL
jgi:hypothetical protein